MRVGGRRLSAIGQIRSFDRVTNLGKIYLPLRGLCRQGLYRRLKVRDDVKWP